MLQVYDKWDRDRGGGSGGGGAPAAWPGRDRERDRERERKARAHQMSQAHAPEPDASSLFPAPFRFFAAQSPHTIVACVQEFPSCSSKPVTSHEEIRIE
ncbi:hypothetical protein SFRURICE_003934 [Spodoptera frugiperda]|nr:hypothetical protein SFRURICE_003934 [Spodoptera frugiperda]